MAQITQANVIGRSQNRTALGMMAAYLKMHPNTTLGQLNAKFPKQKIAPDCGIGKLFYSLDEIEQEKREGNQWFIVGNACFVADDEWLVLSSGQKVAFNKVWTANSLALLQKELAKSSIYGEVGSVQKGVPAGFVVNYEYTKKGVPNWAWILLVIAVVIVGYLAYATFSK
ncbi:hypothetical protein [Moraxella marmotae]|uniref:hypothetical protein n=1 Tax=Moraxella marmotae TaxID=3344520 RepID=UPI0035F3B62D